MIDVDGDSFMTGGPRVAAGPTAACTGCLVVVVARSWSRRALTAGPFRRWVACSPAACGLVVAWQAGLVGEAGVRSSALRGTRRGSCRPRRCRRLEVRARSGTPDLRVSLATWSVHATRDASMTYLNQVLALGLGHERLQLRRGKGVDQTRLRHDQEKHLGARQD